MCFLTAWDRWLLSYPNSNFPPTLHNSRIFFLQKVLLSTAFQTFLTTDFAIIEKQCTA